MKKLHLTSPLIVLAMLAVTTGAYAQSDLSERVLSALEVTDQRIEQAQMLVADSGHEIAEHEVQNAVDLQARARSEFARDELRFALDLTLRAKERADRAIALVRGLPDPDRVKAQLERTMEMLERARDQIEECDNEQARAMIHIAEEMQKRAIRAGDEGRYLAALQLTTSARERILKALRMCRMEENVQESADRALRRSDEVISRARDRLTRAEDEGQKVEQARQALERAASVQERAYGEFQAEHYAASLRLTQSARASAYRAIRLLSGRP